MNKNITLTFSVQTIVEAETMEEFEVKRDDLLDELIVKGFMIRRPVVECGVYQLLEK